MLCRSRPEISVHKRMRNMEMHRISWWRTDFGQAEIDRVSDSIRHEHISQGAVTALFEESLGKMLDVPYVVATSSGSTALLMALMAINVGPGDEVIVPNRTWIATAHAPLLLGAKVVLIDVEADRPIIDVEQIEKLISPRTKAIMPVHLNGRAADLKAIRDIASCYGIRVIEDAAQAIGSRNADGLLGTQGDLGCFSLSVSKLISTGQGGFVVTRNEAFYRELKSVRTHGVADVVNADWTRLGFNFRFTDILASIGLVQLAQLPERIAKVLAIYDMYEAAMKNMPHLQLVPVDIAGGEIPVYVEVLCPQRQHLLTHLANNDIDARPLYPDLDRAKYFNNASAFPNSRKYGDDGVILPCGPGQSKENIKRVIKALEAFSIK